MKLILKIASPSVFFVVLLASALAQEPRDQFPQAIAAFQKNATEDNARRLAELSKQLDPPPAVPEDAEFHALKGAAFVKQAGDAAAFAKAAAEFQAAITIAPWVGEYHYNLAVCEKSAGQFAAARTAAKFAQILARDDKERHDCLALRAELEAAQELAAVKQAEQEKITRATEEKNKAEQAKRDVITRIKNAVGDRRYGMKTPSYSKTEQMGGVSDNELFNGGQYFLWDMRLNTIYQYWKFDELHAELWDSKVGLWIRGESTGPDINDMRWTLILGNEAHVVWGRFNLERSRLYVGEIRNKPANDSEVDPNKRYHIEIFDPL
jgi:tetratricopeptide (TPR) repeat protein